MNRAISNYWVDVGIGLAGVVSAISGLVFLLPGDPATGVLGISYQVWNGVHTWSSLAAIAGVGAHTVLHWRWMVAMTKQMLRPQSRQVAVGVATEPAYGEMAGSAITRRAFLTLGGTAVAATGLVLAGYQFLFGSNQAEASQLESQSTVTGQVARVACPFGLVNDPYPGRCRHYVDANGDGICDYSVAGSGSNLAADWDASFGGAISRRRQHGGQP